MPHSQKFFEVTRPHAEGSALGRFHWLIRGLKEDVKALKADMLACMSGIGSSPERVPMMYGAYDAFVLPTTHLEFFGIIAIEALAYGRPVLASPVGAIPEILNRVEPQWMARSADEHAIAYMLGSFLRCGLPRYLAQEVRSVVKCHYDCGSALSRLADFMLGQLNW